MRKTVTVGGFEVDSTREEITAALKRLTTAEDKITDLFTRGRYTTRGFLTFENSEAMWKFLEKHKGKRFDYKGKTLFHTIEKTPEEQEISRRTSEAAKVVREHLIDLDVMKKEATALAWKDRVPIDFDMGVVRYKPLGGTKPARVLVMNREGLFEVGGEVEGVGLQRDVLVGHLADLNRR